MDLQAQNKITITIEPQVTTRYATLRAYTKNAEQYYVNEYCLPIFNLHWKNFNELREKIRAFYQNSRVEDCLIVIENKLYLYKTKKYNSDGEEEISLTQFDGEEFVAMTKKCRISYTGIDNVRSAINRLVFSPDMYPLGVRRKCGKPRKYRKSEIQASNLSQNIKDELCRMHDKYFVLFTREGEFIGLYPRDNADGSKFEINTENVEYLNETLETLYGAELFEVILIKYDEKLLTEGVLLC